MSKLAPDTIGARLEAEVDQRIRLTMIENLPKLVSGDEIYGTANHESRVYVQHRCDTIMDEYNKLGSTKYMYKCTVTDIYSHKNQKYVKIEIIHHKNESRAC